MNRYTRQLLSYILILYIHLDFNYLKNSVNLILNEFFQLCDFLTHQYPCLFIRFLSLILDFFGQLLLLIVTLVHAITSVIYNYMSSFCIKNMIRNAICTKWHRIVLSETVYRRSCLLAASSVFHADHFAFEYVFNHFIIYQNRQKLNRHINRVILEIIYNGIGESFTLRSEEWV